MEIHITPAPDANPADLTGGISTTVLRRLPLQPPAPEPNARPRHIWRSPKVIDRNIEKIREEIARHPGSAGREPIFYAIVADTYIELLMHGEKRLLQAIANRVSTPEQPVSSRTVENWLRIAKSPKFGLLETYGTPGKQGGHLTDAARVLLGRPTIEEVERDREEERRGKLYHDGP